MRPEKQTSFLSAVDEAILAEKAVFVGATTHADHDELYYRMGAADLAKAKAAAEKAGAKNFTTGIAGPGTFGVKVFFADAPDV